jgi:large subunit ribosomal protein L18
MKAKNVLYSKANRLQRRKNRTNTIIKKTASLPRLIVRKSNMYTSAQVVDLSGNVLAYATDKGAKGTKTERAFTVGKTIASMTKEKGVDQVVFDRNGNRYHGRIKSLSEGAREGGLKN